jgi:DNA-binding MarR family transcriptional regulator
MYKPGRIRSPRWRDIAILCREQGLTVPAIAREMQVQPGSIRSLIGSMRRESLLDEVQTDARGTALKLTREGRAALGKRESIHGADSLLPSGERLVFVIDEGHGIPNAALATLADDPEFRWAARVDGPVKWIASFGSGDAVAADRAATALADSGARAVVGRVDGFFDAEALALVAARMAPPRPALASSRRPG